MIDQAFAQQLLAENIAAGNNINNLPGGGGADPGILAAAGMGPAVQSAGALTSVNGVPRLNIGTVPMTGLVRQNQRGVAPLAIPQMPNRQIGLNEALIRIGGQGVRGAQQGGLESFANMTDQFGAIQDYNRSRALEEYNASLNAYKAETARQKALQPKATKAKGLTAKHLQENQEQVGQIDQTLSDMDDLIKKLEPGGVTGYFDTWVAGIFDKASGDPDRVTRLALMDLKVDATLLKTAQTKGAISDREMKLFESPTPSIDDQESVWIDWIKKRQVALRKVRDRLSDGTTVDNPATAEQVQSFATKGGGVTASGGANLAEADAIVARM